MIIFLFLKLPSVEDPLRMNRFPLRSLVAALALASGSLAAAPLDDALDESQRLAAEAKASQGRVEQTGRCQS